MSFTYPLGLLGLIGIPVLIVIYILQSKYTEQTVASTYLWTLSEKFLRKRNPLSGLTGLISLILQILMITAVTFAISHPVFVLPGAAYDYCFVVDTSSSMMTEDGNTTRMERAKDEMIKVINKSKDGSSYTIITVDDTAEYVLVSVADKDVAKEYIEELSAGHTASDYTDVYNAAQGYFDENTSARIYLVTDKVYGEHENMELISVGSEGKNVGLSDLTYSHSGGRLKVSVAVTSYMQASDVEVILTVDGGTPVRVSVNAPKDEAVMAELEYSCLRFDSFTVSLAEGDNYAPDDSLTTYNIRSDKTYSTLIVSADAEDGEGGFFFHAVIDALLDSEVVIMSPEEYKKNTDSYGLYIFNNCEPEVLPDGAVWLINADVSIPDSGFGVRGIIELGSSTEIEKSTSTSTVVRNLLRGVDGSEIYIKDYVKYSGMYLNFYTLFSYENNPLIFAGANALGNRQVVIGFDINKTDLALSSDFVILARNLLEYSFPDVVTKTNYVVGEEALVNVLAGAKNLKAISPSGKEIYLESTTGTATLKLDEIGTYTVSLTLAGVDSVYRIYSGADPVESVPVVEEGDISLSGERTDEKIDGRFDPIWILFISIAVLFMADWGVYLYEKYQLR